MRPGVQPAPPEGRAEPPALLDLPRYEVAPTVMVRTPLMPMPEGTACEDELARAFVDDPILLEALWVASPSLARQLEEYAAAPAAVPVNRRRRLFDALARYHSRATTRPTPFGLFSGVGVAAWGSRLELRVGRREDCRRWARLDFTKVQALARELEGEDRHRGELELFANPALHVHGRRVYLPDRGPLRTKQGEETFSLRGSESLEKVLSWARTPVAYDIIADKLAQEYPDLSADARGRFLDELVGEGVLLSTLRPSLSGGDPLTTLREKVAGRSSPGAERVRETAARVDAYRASPLGAGLEPLKSLFAVYGATLDRQRCLQVDMSVPISGTVPRELAETAKDAFLALLCLSPAEPGFPHLNAYAGEFADRYGDREVPILELLDDHLGLGPPATYEHPAPARARVAPEPATRNIGFLRALAAERGEVVLTLGDLEPLRPRGAHHPPSADLFLMLAQGAAEDDGWLAVVSPTGARVPAGSAFGRFWQLNAGFDDHLRRCAAHEKSAGSDVVIADVSYAHPAGHAKEHVSNMMLAPRLRAAEIAFGIPPAGLGRQLPMSDLVVGLEHGLGREHGRLYARSRTLGTRVIARTPGMVVPPVAPNPIRFLLELSEQDLWRPAWSWGELIDRPALPRVRIGRAVLAPARWRLPERWDGAPDPDADLRQWRTDWSVPRHVYAGEHESDNRLLLNLDSPRDIELLRHQMRQGVTAVEEPLPGRSHAAARGPGGAPFMTEVVVSLLADPPRPEPAAPPRHDRGPSRLSPRLLPPESEWWCFQLYGLPSLQDLALEHLAGGLGAEGLEWHFSRCPAPRPHLLVHVRADGGAAPRPPVPAVAGLLDQGLITDIQVTGCERDIEWYGGAAAAECERIFCTETPMIVRLLGLTGETCAADQHAALDDRDLAILSVDTLLTGIGVERHVRTAVFHRMRDARAQEFAGLRHLDRKLLNRELNGRKKRLRSLLLGTHAALGAGGGLARWREDFLAALEQARPRVPAFTAPTGAISPVLSHLVSMHANRLGFFRGEEYRLVHHLYEVSQGLLRV